jgi:hypothetical protein
MKFAIAIGRTEWLRHHPCVSTFSDDSVANCRGPERRDALGWRLLA